MSIVCPNDPHLFDAFTSNFTKLVFQKLLEFSGHYKEYHPYLTTLICTIGVCVNLVHIIVLTRRQMRPYIVNSILALIAFCDVFTMCTYLLYTARFELFAGENMGYSYSWLLFLLLHVVVSIALHTISLYLIVAMAYIRVIALERLDTRWTKHRSIRWIFLIISSTVLLLSIPSLLVHDIIPMDYIMNDTIFSGLFTIGVRGVFMENSCLLFKLNLWLTGIFFKVIPCVLLMLFTIVLLKKLYETGKKRQLLYNSNANGNGMNGRKVKSRWDKTTFMLAILLAIFLVTELPQGFIAILNARYTNDVHVLIYAEIGELLDLLSLINCNVGFFLYVSMSSHYRKTFRALFQIVRKKKFSQQQSNPTRIRMQMTDVIGLYRSM